MQDKWISVKDRLPENGNGVLVGRFNKRSKFYSIGIDNYMGYGKWWDKDYNEEVWSITHWMPLPEEPKIEMQEVKYGYWHLLDDCANAGVYCSVCNKKVYKTDYANQKVKSKYCPNCGAKMDGGDTV